MPRIVLRHEIDGVIDFIDVPVGTSFFDAATEKWPEGFPDYTVSVYDTDEMLQDEDSDMVHIPMEADEVWVIVITPQGLEVAFAAILSALSLPSGAVAVSIFTSVVMGAVSLIGLYLLRPKLPGVGNSPYEWDDGGQPQWLSAQSNQLRIGSRVPDVFGTIRVWPDLVSEPVINYDGQGQTLDELYVVSNGYVKCSDAKLHDEEVTDIGSSTPTVYYHPGENWPADFEIVKTNSFVAGVELPAQNEVGASTANITMSTTGTVAVDIDGYFDDFTASVGTRFSISSDTMTANNRKLYKILSISGDGKTLTVTPAPSTNETFTGASFRGISFVHEVGGVPLLVTPNFENKYTIRATGSGYTWVQAGSYDLNQTSLGAVRSGAWYNPGNDFPASGTVAAVGASFNIFEGKVQSTRPPDTEESTVSYPAALQTGLSKTQHPFVSGYFVIFAEGGNYNPEVPGTGYQSGIFTVPGGITNTLYFDVEAPGGMYHQTAGGIPERREVTIAIRTRWRTFDPDTGYTYGPWTAPTNYTFGATSRTAQRWTQQHTYNNNEVECYFERVTDYIPDTSTDVTVDAVRIIGLRGKVLVSPTTFGPLDVTLARIRLDTQNAPQVQRQRAFNVVAERCLVDYLGTGNIEQNTNKVKDGILHTLLSENEYAIDQIDTASLLSVQADLDAISSSEGQWNGLIDQTFAAEDQLRLFTGPKRISVYRQAGLIYFTRPKGGMLPTSLVNARTKIAPEKRTIGFGFANDPTHVVVRFRDVANNYVESSVQYPATGALNPIEQTALGVTDAEVAQRLARYTYDQTTYGRDLVEVPMGAEGILIGVGDVINVTDSLQSERPIEGEILIAQTDVGGDLILFDQEDPAGSYRLRIRGQGSDSLIENLDVVLPLEAGSATSAGNQFVIPGVYITSNLPLPPAQVGLLYSFTPTSSTDADMVLVTSVSPSNEGPVTVAGMVYRDEMYASDTDPVVITLAGPNRR